MILASHGLIASSILQVDADWLAYYNRVIAAGGSLTTTEQNATKTLVADMKAAGIWTPMKAIYPMVGASAAACAQNLRSASFTGTFSSGWTFASTGVTPNGTSAYMNTNLNWNTNTSLNDVSVGCYWRDIPLSTKYYGMVDGTLHMIIRDRAVCDYYINDNGTGAVATMARGLHSATRKSSTQTTLYVNGSGSAQSAVSTSKPNLNLWFGAINGVANYNSNQIALSFVSDGLDATQNSNFYTAVQAFQTTLSRQV